MLKKQCASTNNSEENLKKIAILTADNENLKNENELLNSSNSILEIDVSYLTEKVSSLM